MNAIDTKTNAATISRILNAAGIRKSETGRGRVSTVESEGFKVSTLQTGAVVVQYRSYSSVSISDSFESRRELAMKEIETILTSKGYLITPTQTSFIVVKAVA
jgi:hypothetical protein